MCEDQQRYTDEKRATVNQIKIDRNDSILIDMLSKTGVTISRLSEKSFAFVLTGLYDLIDSEQFLQETNICF